MFLRLILSPRKVQASTVSEYRYKISFTYKKEITPTGGEDPIPILKHKR